MSERTRRAIYRVRAAGGAVTLATGRTYRSASAASAELSLTTPIVTFQGALVSDPRSGESLWHVPLTTAMMESALHALAGRDDIEIRGDLGDDLYIAAPSDWSRQYSDRHGVPIRVVDADWFASTPMTRLVVRGADHAIERLEIDLKRRLDGSMYVTRSLSYFCEILHPDGGKDKALDWLSHRLGVERSDTIAFGNGYNDVQMLEWAGMSVAVDDAVPQVLDVADVVAPSMERDGVAQILEGLLDRGMIG